MQTAEILLASLPELERANNREMAKLVGLTPMAREGEKMHGGGHICGGRARVRCALFMAPVSAARSNPKLSDFYNRFTGEVFSHRIDRCCS